VSDLVLARNELGRGLRGQRCRGRQWLERLSCAIAETRETITRMRMARVEHLFSALPRLVRDLVGRAREAG
jgi:two-component system chemotaxis sensor kinase CheA